MSTVRQRKMNGGMTRKVREVPAAPPPDCGENASSRSRSLEEDAASVGVVAASSSPAVRSTADVAPSESISEACVENTISN